MKNKTKIGMRRHRRNIPGKKLTCKTDTGTIFNIIGFRRNFRCTFGKWKQSLTIENRKIIKIKVQVAQTRSHVDSLSIYLFNNLIFTFFSEKNFAIIKTKIKKMAEMNH